MENTAVTPMRRSKKFVFTLKSTLTLELDFEFAMRVAACLQASGTVDKQIIELARQLKLVEEKE